MSKQLLDNKIDTTNTPEYIEKTLIGTVKLWFLNLAEESKKVLRCDNKTEGTSIPTKILPTKILKKYEITIRDEFSSVTTEEEEQNKEKVRIRI